MKLYNYIKDINIEGIKSAFQLLSFFHSDKGKSILNAISKDKFLIDYEKLTVEQAKEYIILLNISELIVSLINNDPEIENLFPAEVKNAFMNVYCKLIPWKEMFEGIINIENFDVEHYVLKKGSIIQSKIITTQKNEKNPNALQKILLTGPTWTDEEYKSFLLTREQLKLFPQKWF